MPIDTGALKTELGLPAYAANVALGDVGALAAQLNTVGQGASFQVNREPISTALFLANVASAEYLALTQLKLMQLTPLMAVQTIDINDASTQAILIGIFGNPSTTRTNIIAILKRQGSRAEVLFGPGTAISNDDVIKALR